MPFASAQHPAEGAGVSSAYASAPPLLSQHADYVHPWEFGAFLREVGPLPFDVMLEAKMKDQALLKLRDDLTRLKLW